MKIAQVSAIAAIGLIPWVFTQAFGAWSPPLKIREQTGQYLNVPQLVTGGTGSALVLWSEGAFGEPQKLWSRLTSAGPWGWGPASEVSDGTAIFQPPAAVAMHTDGRGVVVWQEFVESALQSRMMFRQFVPGSGWGPIRQLGASETYTPPALLFAPDGRAHLVFFQNGAYVATTLGPGEDAWTPEVALSNGTEAYGQAALAAGPGFVYAAYRTSQGIDVAAYDAGGWHPGRAAVTGGVSSAPELLSNGTHVALTWSESDGNHVQRLTGPAESFMTPRSICNVALAPDGGAIAVCPVQGDTVPGCREPSSGGTIEAFYEYLEAYRRAASGDWSSGEVISSQQKRVHANTRLLSNPVDGVLTVWQSDVPCEPGSRETLARAYSSLSASWAPEEQLWSDRAPATPTQTILSELVDARIDVQGAPHALIAYFESDYLPTLNLLSELFVLDGTAPKTQQAEESRP